MTTFFSLKKAMFLFISVSILLGLVVLLLPSPPLIIGIHPWIGYETLYLAREFHWLPSGVILHEGKTAGDSLRGLKSGVLDGAALTLDETLSARAEGVPLSIVAVFDVSSGSDVVLARKKFQILEELRGQRVAVEHSAVGEIMLSNLLRKAGLTIEDITVINLRIDEQVNAWKKNQMDIVISYEPTVSRLENEGAIRIFDSRHIPETIFDVLTIRRDRMKRRGQSIRSLLTTHFKALDYMRMNRQDAMYRIATRQEVTWEVVQRSLSGITLPNIHGNISYFMPHSPLIRAARTLNMSMTSASNLERLDELKDLLNSNYLPRGEVFYP